jgi:hypothetical protein
MFQISIQQHSVAQFLTPEKLYITLLYTQSYEKMIGKIRVLKAVPKDANGELLTHCPLSVFVFKDYYSSSHIHQTSPKN